MTKPRRPCRGARRRPEAIWDERNLGYCDQPNVWDVDPGKYPCATVPDLIARIGPRCGSAGSGRRSDEETLSRGCPGVELTANEPASRSVSCRFELPTLGTREFLRRRAQEPAVAR